MRSVLGWTLTAAGACCLTACAPAPVEPACPPPVPTETTAGTTAPVIYVAANSWHSDIGLPIEDLTGPLAYFRQKFPTARSIMIGYGKQKFITEPAHSPDAYMLGPFSGPGAIQVQGLSTLPSVAYLPGETVALRLSPDGEATLEAFIWQELVKTHAGDPTPVASDRPGFLFYAARSSYSLEHTCNRWAADALHAAGLPVDGDGVVFSGQVMRRAAAVSARQCPVD